MKTLYSGEALTADDMYERQEEEDKHKLEKEQQKGKGQIRWGVLQYSKYIHIHNSNTGKAKPRNASRKEKEADAFNDPHMEQSNRNRTFTLRLNFVEVGVFPTKWPPFAAHESPETKWRGSCFWTAIPRLVA